MGAQAGRIEVKLSESDMREETRVQRQLDLIHKRISEGGILDLTDIEEEAEHGRRIRASARALKDSVELFRQRYRNQATEVESSRNAIVDAEDVECKQFNRIV